MAVPALAHAAFHAALQRKIDVVVGNVERAQPQDDELVHDRRAAKEDAGVGRVEINARDVVRGNFVEIIPYTRIVFTWGWEGENSPLPPGSTTVEISLIPDDDGTIVQLRHIGLPQEQKAVHAEGWDHFLPRLGRAAEGKQPDQDPWTM